MDVPQFNNSPSDRCLGCFQFLANADKDATNIQEQVLWSPKYLFLWGNAHEWNCWVAWKVYVQVFRTAYYPDNYTILHFLLAMYEWSSFSVALPGFYITIYYFSYLKYVVIFHCGHNLDFSYSYWWWTSSHVLFDIFFSEMSFHIFCPFPNWIVFLLLNFVNSFIYSGWVLCQIPSS